MLYFPDLLEFEMATNWKNGFLNHYRVSVGGQFHLSRGRHGTWTGLYCGRSFGLRLLPAGYVPSDPEGSLMIRTSEPHFRERAISTASATPP